MGAAHIDDAGEDGVDSLRLGVTHVGELVGVLERVSAEAAARLLEAVDHLAIAFPVLWDLGRIGVVLEMGGEEHVGELAVLELLLKFLVSFWGALFDNALIGEVEVAVTRVDHLDMLLVWAKSLFEQVLRLLKKGLNGDAT